MMYMHVHVVYGASIKYMHTSEISLCMLAANFMYRLLVIVPNSTVYNYTNSILCEGLLYCSRNNMYNACTFVELLKCY
jgi:hypothetical protein